LARLQALLAGDRVEGSLDAEVRSAIEDGALAGPSLGVDKLRILRAELEGLVGELLSRGVRAPMREAEGSEAQLPEGSLCEATDNPAPESQSAGRKKGKRRREGGV
ncbi:MAG: hypothetical protein WCQ50_12995, partial [Spirochaetota bacterium]